MRQSLPASWFPRDFKAGSARWHKRDLRRRGYTVRVTYIDGPYPFRVTVLPDDMPIEAMRQAREALRVHAGIKLP